jgi:hypothetical protein
LGYETDGDEKTSSGPASSASPSIPSSSSPTPSIASSTPSIASLEPRKTSLSPADNDVVKQKLRASAMSILAKHGVNSPSSDFQRAPHEVAIFTFPSAPSPPPTCKPADNFACPFVFLSDKWDLHGMTFESFDKKRVHPSIESRKVSARRPQASTHAHVASKHSPRTRSARRHLS